MKRAAPPLDPRRGQAHFPLIPPFLVCALRRRGLMGSMGLNGAWVTNRIVRTPLCVDRGDAQRHTQKMIAMPRPIDAVRECECAFDMRRRICALKFPPQPHGGISYSQVQDRPPPCGSLFSGTFHPFSRSLSHASPLAVRCRCCRRWRRRRPGFHALGWLLDHHPLAPPGTGGSTKSPAFFLCLPFSAHPRTCQRFHAFPSHLTS
jgi:hypothetical protein